jgi:hypothetical protein
MPSASQNQLASIRCPVCAAPTPHRNAMKPIKSNVVLRNVIGGNCNSSDLANHEQKELHFFKSVRIIVVKAL